MRDVIQQVIATEAEAKHLVEAATAEAARIKTAAQKEADETLARIRQETRSEAERVVEAAVAAAEAKKQELLRRIAAEIQAQVQLEDMTKERAVMGAVRCVCGQLQRRQDLS